MKRTLLFMVCVLASLTMSAQSEQNDYIPFVEMGKQWHVVRTSFGAQNYHSDTYMMNEEVVKDGKTYLKMYRSEDDLTVVYDAGLLREEDRKVYIYDADKQEEHLIFDYSLKAGDTYEAYSSDENKMLSYKVVSVGDCTECPRVRRFYYDENADSTVISYRKLRQWTVCRTDNESIQKTWIEGVGSLEGPLENLYDNRPVSSRSYLAYVFFNDIPGGDYFPFSFYDTLNRNIHGCDLPKTASYISEDWHSHMTYELEGDRLHVYGQLVLNCGCYNYAYFFEEPTDDPLVHKLHFEIQDVGEPATCVNLFDTDFYVLGFDPNLNYIVVDNNGEEHPVINKTPQNEYRPFIEGGKVWAVKVYPDGFGTVRNDTWMEYYYFDGDSIIDGRMCKQMKYITNATEDNWVNGVFTPANFPQYYVGAWYEQDKKVYYADNRDQHFELFYDFTLSSYDSIPSPDGAIMVVNKVSGGIPGFKGTYYDFWCDGYWRERWLEGVGSESWPWLNHPYGFCGHTGILLTCSVGDEVFYYNSEVEDPYIMGAQKRRFDFTHTTKLQPKTPRRSEEEQSLYGEYNDNQLGINLDPLDEAYLVRITDETGKTVYEKAIDAGNIVALNVDISAYAKGRYTVTVENSNEAFTGEFETQTTGIEEISSKRSEVRGYIYNLQGQRLSTLQKGLNIVNGKKVFVKSK